jgi:predicted MFS family arabinose efflux permease
MRFPRHVEAPARDHITASRKWAQWSRSLADKTALQDLPFVLLVTGLMTQFMGIYVVLYYINLLATERMNVSSSIASQSLTIVNGASTVGRILPSILADRIGPVHILGLTAFLSSAMTFCLLAVYDTAPLIIWSVAFGSCAGAFMGLPAAGLVSISNSTSNIGKRLGMTLGTVGCGVLIAEPIAGAILVAPSGGWVGLVAWSASLMLAGYVLLTAARIRKTGSKLLVRI